MKGLFFVLAIALFFSCDKNKEETEISIPTIYSLKNAENITLKNDTVFFDNRKYDGYLYELAENQKDTILLEGYKDGLLEGVQKKWYENKQIMELRHYSKGTKNGAQIAYWENGQKKFEFTAKNDAYEGEMKEWTFDGKLIHLATYKDGQEDGQQKLWYDNGKIRANYVIIKGKRFGLLGTKNCKNVSDSVFVVR
ncbi:toxin-antitoxin system YwqK family antitoxin [Lacihabitans sp. LS3-19]|uniref:toxin-antitoxin system YwqK family antitoxin n=1 Tax=Lacihabitans sp. LS3-19 TaxID=2487335 RepID=UPI0020CB852D|nr:toxin-antitoxin system YwqK family antitoxin [Lacihabitans sp. LS3-19]MCP9766476.1 toxin-antitoxin system YwqK family antitoxin [Lacihabitans sp. LS3-19]